tara:strand:- start:52 stop:309 length:258 start_codon:yes stop_codon:yes gene_type:complete
MEGKIESLFFNGIDLLKPPVDPEYLEFIKNRQKEFSISVTSVILKEVEKGYFLPTKRRKGKKLIRFQRVYSLSFLDILRKDNVNS